MQKNAFLHPFILLAACIPPASAIAQITITEFQTPNDNELHSAYCMSLLSKRIEYTQKGLAQWDAGARSNNPPAPQSTREWSEKQRAEIREDLAKMIAAHDRLKSYLLPKEMVLDPSAMALATKRGEADWREYLAMTERCSAKCSPVPVPPEDQAKACWSSCSDAALLTRIQNCASPTWLPY